MDNQDRNYNAEMIEVLKSIDMSLELLLAWTTRTTTLRKHGKVIGFSAEDKVYMLDNAHGTHVHRVVI